MRYQATALALVSVLSVAAPAGAMAADSDYTLTGNMGLFTDYRFRGLTQTMEQPALQGGFDLAHASGLYVGNWNSNVSSAEFGNANLEMDFYGGYKASLTDAVSYDVGALYYYYPGSDTSGQTIDNTEVYAAVSYKTLTLKYNHAVSDFFGVQNTKGSGYLDLSGSYDLGNGLTLSAHVGHQKVKNLSDYDYTDWKVGISKDISGYVVGLSYYDTDAKDASYTYSDARKTINIGEAGAVLSLTRSF